MIDMNQNPKQNARDKIDALLRESGWVVQPVNTISDTWIWKIK